FARRSRGYVPRPLFIKETDTQVLALGAEQKASFCLSKGTRAFPSQHIGDLKNIESYENYVSQIESFERLFEIKPQLLACDLHPDYLSSRYGDQRAEEQGLELIKVQHHHAHMASCMADNGLDEPVIGIIWDGTGLGAAKNSWTAGEKLQPGSGIWGSEFLTGDFGGFERQASIRPIRLPGGDRAVDEIWRAGASMLLDAGLEDSYMELQAGDGMKAISAERLDLVRRMLDADVNCPKSSGMGRLFDGAAALLGIKTEAGYEGQGAVLLEVEAESWLYDTAPELNAGSYTIEFYEENGLRVFDWRPIIREMLEELAENRRHGEGPGSCAAHFMNTLLLMALRTVQYISERTGIRKVVLSGGTFQNIYMMERLPKALEALGFAVYTHQRVSTNDEGLSLGQLMIAERIANVSGSTSEN
ncbi:MAG: carbamoyltransferase HypF, partial [Firmicutes bacterium]|nr:carbamoyltransferase HypF [Bacillota bacterium]